MSALPAKLGPAALVAVAVACGAVNMKLGTTVAEIKRDALGAGAPAPPPPEVAVPTVLLGAFRGLVVDYLWLRAVRLEEDGKFYEAKDLAEWISTLEPRLEQVWSFQAHGLAYNLSAASDDPVERYKWINAGIELLRDRGIRLNPRSPELYFMLSRIYSDKIGGPFDDYQVFLKKYLAIELVRAFGPLGEDPDLEALANAPETLGPAESALVAELEAAGLELEKFGHAWDEALSRAPKKARELAKQAPPEVLRRVRAHFRAPFARKLGLDPAKCVVVEKEYGPLEWRGCDAVSLYWAKEGMKAAETLGPTRAARERRRLERVAINSVKHAMRRGRLVLLPEGELFFGAEPRLVPVLVKLYDDAIASARIAEKAGEQFYAEDEEDDGHHHEKPQGVDLSAAMARHSLEDARKDTLIEGIGILARYGREAEARRLWAIFKREQPQAAENSYEEFVNWLLEFEVMGEGGSLVSTNQILLGCWKRAWIAFAHGEDNEALGRIALADRAYREWDRKVKAFIANGDLEAARRLGTPDLKKVKEESLKLALEQLANRPGMRKRLEERAGSLLAPKDEPGGPK